MRYRKLAGGGDYSFGNGQQDFWRDVPQAVGQAVGTRLKLWLGEWYLDINEGTAFMQGILGKYSLAEAAVIIQDRALKTQGMVDIQNYDSTLDPDTRKLTVQFDIDTIYGPTAVQVANYANY